MRFGKNNEKRDVGGKKIQYKKMTAKKAKQIIWNK